MILIQNLIYFQRCKLGIGKQQVDNIILQTALPFIFALVMFRIKKSQNMLNIFKPDFQRDDELVPRP